MSGFANSLLGGASKLIRAAIRSPNYVPGVSGWSINKDGSAEFRDIQLPSGSGGAVITIGAVAPASPHTGDLWLNTAAGLELSQWNGSAWVAYQYGTSAIADGAITASLLQAGIVVAGIIDGTTINAATFTGSTFEGTDFLIDSSGEFRYSGTPAKGNLIYSDTGAAGTDAYGNAYLAGAVSYLPGSPCVAIAIDGGNITYYTAAAAGGPWNVVATIDQGVPSGYAGLRLQILDGTASATAYLLSDGTTGQLVTGNADDGTTIAAQNPVTGIPETWQSLGALGVSGMDITTQRYRMQPDGTVRIDIKGHATANIASGGGTFPNLLPAGYIPATITILPAEVDGTGTGNHPHCKISTTGQVIIYWPALSSGNNFGVSGTFTLA